MWISKKKIQSILFYPNDFREIDQFENDKVVREIYKEKLNEIYVNVKSKEKCEICGKKYYDLFEKTNMKICFDCAQTLSEADNTAKGIKKRIGIQRNIKYPGYWSAVDDDQTTKKSSKKSEVKDEHKV